MREGYTIVMSGWDVTVAPGKGRMTITVPVATNPDGSPVTGPALEEFVIDDATTLKGALAYSGSNARKGLGQSHGANALFGTRRCRWRARTGSLSTSGRSGCCRRAHQWKMASFTNLSTLRKTLS